MFVYVCMMNDEWVIWIYLSFDLFLQSFFSFSLFYILIAQKRWENVMVCRREVVVTRNAYVNIYKYVYLIRIFRPSIPVRISK